MSPHLLTLGKIKIDKVVEIERQPVEATWLFPNIDLETLARHASQMGPGLIVGQKLCLSFHSYVIRTGSRTILVDTCNGNHKPRSQAWQHMLSHDTYLSNLARLGLRPEDIDMVLCTHLHADHVGWNTRLADGRWVPTFPNAKYVFSRIDYERNAQFHAEQPQASGNHAAFRDSVLPIVEAGLADIVENDHRVLNHLDDGVWLEPSPGHTPGHVCVKVQSGARECLMTGDALHHPIQLHEPDLVCVGDLDPQQAAETRQAIIDALVDRDCALLTAHFPAPTAGYIVSSQSGPRFHFIDRN